MMPVFAILLQEFNPQDVSWWLPHSAALRTVLWITVLALNLAVLVYFLHKMLFRGEKWSIPSALRERGRGIESHMQQAEASHQQALAKLAEVEARLARLPDDLRALESEARTEAANEYQRLVDESRREADRILSLAKNEMDAAAKLAQRELKGLAASLALDLATRRIREKLTPELDQAVVRQAVARLDGLEQIGGANSRSERVN